MDAGDVKIDDIVIALIGPRKSGKSNFIDILANRPKDERRACHDLSSGTNELEATRILGHEIYGDRVVFVDTPGSDETRSDIDILQLVSDWLEMTYPAKVKLAGVLYLHQITDNRLTDSPWHNALLRSKLRSKLQRLCGLEASKKLILVMTMWDKVAISKGEARELELIDNYWSQMIKSGSTYARFVNNAKSAWEITNPIIKKSQQGNRRIDRKSLLPRSQAKTVNAESLSKDDVIIAVMGPTGSGKSTFINIVAGLASGITTGAGDTLESCTSTINIVKLSFPEYSECNIVFVDTPGFDDTNKSDVEILRMIADWLKKRYQANILLSGLVYFHRISDNRMSGTPVKNLEMFKALSGKKMLTNIVLATTMWDEVDEKTGTDREEELKTKYWKAMVDHGSSTRRFYGTRESALSLLAPLIDEANAKQLVLLQTEMVDLGKKLQSTSAGQALYSKLDMLVKHRQDVVRRMREEMKRASQDLTLIDLLREEYGNLKRQLHSTLDDMQRMKLPIGQRLLRAITRAFTGKDIEAE